MGTAVDTATGHAKANPDEERCRPGDREDFARLVGPHHGAALALAARLLGNHDDAEDALQEALLKTYRGLASLAAPAGFRAWFLRVVFNSCVDARRRRTARRTHEQRALPGLAPAAWQRPGQLDALRRVREVMGELPEKQQAALHLRVFEQLSYQEIGAILGLTPRSARVYLVKARRHVRSRLGAELEER